MIKTSKKQQDGGRTGEETGKVRKTIRSQKEDGKKSKLVIIIRSSWHYLPLLGQTLEALRGGSEGVENSGA